MAYCYRIQGIKDVDEKGAAVKAQREWKPNLKKSEECLRLIREMFPRGKYATRAETLLEGYLKEIELTEERPKLIERGD
jgi:hypothetical protein